MVLWICFRDQATSISDRCGAWQGAGEDGLQAWARRLERTALDGVGGKQRVEQILGQGCGGSDGAGFRHATFEMVIKHPRGNAKQSDE